MRFGVERIQADNAFECELRRLVGTEGGGDGRQPPRRLDRSVIVR